MKEPKGKVQSGAKKKNPDIKPRVGDTRLCPVCGCSVIVTESRRKYGKYRCTPCEVAQVRAYRVGKRNKVREWNRTSYYKNKKNRRDKTRRQREKYPEKYKARMAVQTALRSGKLKKQSCEKCGTERVEAHHDDYSKPLSVRWLCHECHTRVHYPETIYHAMLAEARKEARDD